MSHFVQLSPNDEARRSRKVCSVCGAEAGRWLQHFNRDTGWGLCADCPEWLCDPVKRKHDTTTPEEMADLYGLPGRNYAGRTHRVHGRLFVIVATFKAEEERRINAYMSKYDGVSLLETTADGRAILAFFADEGVPAPAEPPAASN